ncbi:MULTISPECIES: hypothetical protein [Thermomonosporaceae]|uniref:hypothetical protein n=1 Tax=Thermomonosporaceae TaxID=2012 RepID=UPI00255B2D4A|nr:MULTISPECIES: hypothetical protein [Thermomonosporaceae]MDL4773071.1 hypothetical protein [Actinomadura xylanilytica]
MQEALAEVGSEKSGAAGHYGALERAMRQIVHIYHQVRPTERHISGEIRRHAGTPQHAGQCNPLPEVS